MGKRVLCFAVLWMACEEDVSMDEGAGESQMDEGTDGLTCAERFTMFREEGFCPPGMSAAFGEGEFDPVDPPEFERIEFDGGRYQKGYDSEAGELFYMDESCLIACHRSLAVAQPVVCEAVDEEGNPGGCTFASEQDFTLEACMDFVEACG